MDLPLGRRQLLKAAAMSAGAAVLPSTLSGAPGSAAVPPQVTLPERGIYDTAPAGDWTDGFLTGNGEYGAICHGTPVLEKVIFNHHRFVMPNGTRGQTPPVISGRLAGVRDKALAGDYRGADTDFTSGWGLRWTQSFHPGYELRISTPGMTTTTNYARITDFRSGEVISTWTDANGTWHRSVFASRADRVVVHRLTPAPGRTIDATLSVNAALSGVPGSMGFTTLATVGNGSGYLNLRATYPSGQGAFGYEGVTRIVPTGGSVTASGSTVVVTAATQLILLTKLDRYESSTAWDSRPLHAALAALSTDYAALRSRHVAAHGAMYDRSAVDLNVPAADRQRSTTELITRQNDNRAVIDVALLERLYDSGRYLFVSSCGVLPPRLTGLWLGAWGAAWSGDFTTDANVNLQVAGGNILDLTDAMKGYFDLVLGQLAHWRTNARNLYGARGFLAPSRTDGEYGHMLHFDFYFPGHCWTGGADWLLYPLLEYYQVTGDQAFLRDKLGPALMELALFYEDFLTRTDSNGKVVFVPSFSMENMPGNSTVNLAINATGDIQAGRHALQAAIDAANALGVEQGGGQGVQRWTALLAKLPSYTINSGGGIAEWSWPGLTDRQDHRHVQHLYGAWPLHEINPEEQPALVTAGLRALALRGDESMTAHGSIHRALASARLKDRDRVHDNLLKVIGNNMLYKSLMTSHNPNLDIYNADAANAIPGVLAEALVYSRPGILELLPALPSQLSKGAIRGVRGRNRVRVDNLTWDLGARTATVTLTSAVDQGITLIHRRGISSISTSVPVAPSPLGAHARMLTLAAGAQVQVTIGFPQSETVRLVNRSSGKVLDVNGASTADGASLIQWSWTGSANQQWRLVPNGDGSYQLVGVGSGKLAESPSGSGQGTQLRQWANTGGGDQRWQLVQASAGYWRLVNVGNGWCADVEGASTADGAKVITWPGNGGANQEWQIIAI